MFRRLLLVLTLCLACQAASAPAQDLAAEQMLSLGIHGYFSGDFAQAYEKLSSAVSGGNQDPRPYYFRGLVLMRMGREDEAKADFQIASGLESAGQARVHSVAKALERVQGADRRTVEQYRVQARVAASQKAEAERKKRYEESRAEQTRVMQQAEQVPSPKAAASAADAFQTGPLPEKKEAEKKEDMPAAAETPAAEPAPAAAAEPEKKADEPAPADNPFGEAPKKPAAKKAASADDNPFGAADAEKPAAKKPAAKKADDDNPFK